MHNQNIVITGGTDGIGKATAIRLAKLGAHLLLISRNSGKGTAAVSEIKQISGNNAIMFLQADLSIVKNVKCAAEQIRAKFDHVNVLVHCAGNIFPNQRTLTEEGLELSFAIQYMARYMLTNELLDLLQAASNPQVLSVAGGGTIPGQVDFYNIQGDQSYNFMQAVKTAGMVCDLLTLEQIERYPDIVFYNYGPGLVRSGQIVKNPATRLFIHTVGRLFSRSPMQAANDIVALLTNEYPSGLYSEAVRCNETPECADAASRKRMWEYGKTAVSNILAAA